MQEEKRNNNTVWYSYRDYEFKVTMLDSGNAVVWVNFKGYNIAFPMIIREFLYDMEEYINFDVMVLIDALRLIVYKMKLSFIIKGRG